jgi:hypothetical protein
MTKKTLTQALNKVDREKDRVESRLVRAKQAGTVSDIRVRVGSALQSGDQVLQVVDPDAQPEIWAFLPGKDRPRLRLGQDLQVEIVGYTKARDQAKITYVSTETLGPTEAAKIVGSQLADSIKLANGSYVCPREATEQDVQDAAQHVVLSPRHAVEDRGQDPEQAVPGDPVAGAREVHPGLICTNCATRDAGAERPRVSRVSGAGGNRALVYRGMQRRPSRPAFPTTTA